MTRSYRSRRSRLADLAETQRAAGRTWAQIAAIIADAERVNTRVAMRLAHGLTQTQVAAIWNDRWPPGPASSGVTDKNISYWETWPQSGHEPSLRTLKRLAQLYCCDVGELIDDGRFGHLDAVAQPIAATRVIAKYDDAAATVVTATGTEHPPEAAWSALEPFSKLVLLAEQPSRSLRDREACYEELVHVLTGWASTMKRRDLLRTLAWAASTAATVPIFSGLELGEQEQVVRVLDGQHRVDESVVGHIETVLWAAMRQDDALGPQAVLDTVLAQRRLARTILADCPAALRARLLSLFANLSRFAGWLCFDLSDLDSAAHFYEQARIAAHEAENTELGIFVLCNLSHLATWRGQPRVGIDHAVAATAWANDTDDTLLRAYVADVSARAYARAGMQRACLDALASIPSCLDNPWARTPADSLAYFYGPGQYSGSRAGCLLLLGRTSDALDSAREALTLSDPSFVRNRAFEMVHLGTAYIQSQQAEAAACILSQAADIAARNGSARLVEMLRQARHRLRQWDQVPAIKDLDDRLAAYGWGLSSVT